MKVLIAKAYHVANAFKEALKIWKKKEKKKSIWAKHSKHLYTSLGTL